MHPQAFEPAASSGTVRLGIVGCGNMGGAFARGIAAHKELQSAFSLTVYEPGERAALAMQELGARLAPSAYELARQSELILLAVKPQHMGGVLKEIAPAVAETNALPREKGNGLPGKVALSIAAGVSLDFLRQGLNQACPVVRAMPNTLLVVSQGQFGLCFDSRGPAISDAWKKTIRRLLGSLGQLVELDESKMNAFTALAGSGPAYVFHFLDSLAEAGVSAGLTRESSREIALGLIRGCAALMDNCNEHPVALREQVSSPAGTTLAALNHLDRTAVRGHLIDAVLAALSRGNAMEKEQ